MEAERLIGIMRGEVESLTRGEGEVAVAYSGGLDSSIIAALASESAPVKAYTCAVAGSHDSKNAEARAKEGGIPFSLILLEDDDLVSLVGEVSKLLRSNDPIRLAYTIPVFSVIDRSAERTVLTGSGADELFGGYAKYVSAATPDTLMRADLAKMVEENTVLSKFASGKGKLLGSPFLSEAVTRFSRSIDLAAKIQAGERKVILREAARMLGLGSHDAPKKAAQYSSGILKRMQRLAKAEGLDLSHWISKTIGTKRSA